MVRLYKREEKNVLKVVRAITVKGKIMRPKNTWEQPIKKDIKKLSITVEFCEDRRECCLRILRPDSAQCGKRAGR